MATDLENMTDKFAKDSIVTKALGRLISQMLTEVHETRIAPLEARLKERDDFLRNYGLWQTFVDSRPTYNKR